MIVRKRGGEESYKTTIIREEFMNPYPFLFIVADLLLFFMALVRKPNDCALATSICEVFLLLLF